MTGHIGNVKNKKGVMFPLSSTYNVLSKKIKELVDMFNMLVAISVLGLLAMGGTGTASENKKEVKEEKYTVEWCKNNLRPSKFDFYEVQCVAEHMKDFYIRKEVEYLMKSGYSFNDAVEEMVREGKIKTY